MYLEPAVLERLHRKQSGVEGEGSASAEWCAEEGEVQEACISSNMHIEGAHSQFKPGPCRDGASPTSPSSL